MRTVDYSTASLFRSAVAPLALALVGLLIMSSGGAFSARGIAAIVVSGLTAVGPIRKVLRGRPALSFDDKKIEISDAWGLCSVPWSDVRVIEAVSTTKYLLRFFPLRTTTTLMIKRSGWQAHRMSIDMHQLDLPQDQWPELLGALNAARARGNSLSALSAETDWAAADAGADAVIARYLAEKGTSPSPQTQTQVPLAPSVTRPQPGQRAVSVPSRRPQASLAVAGARPQFGRRA